ncbi:hypothetical protein CXB49_07860 [Chromobacterium sp. ATCC 53434]|uniref:hypothetical protein n=1 Tax=Chromobacterium sp. (strain ATCC 53434 / SC 14030) TaxID=2059672 RepID=UPI000C786CF5|nr:hypothetical protein [Chromobacterium sp. ATCC 53434]AUH50724.1 hypothetical protein CXB49_07860 [Chromobacterium sp. ATCC 53434]
MEFLKHLVKIIDNLTLAVLTGAIAPAVKSVIEGNPVPAYWIVSLVCAFLFYLLMQVLNLWLLYNFIDFPRKTSGGG